MCKKTWDKTSAKHCIKCCITLNNDFMHCCDCRKIWNLSDKHHCQTCCITYKNNHCCDCCVEYDESQTHCCKCKMNYNKIDTIHCSECCKTYTCIFHCCKCRIEYDKSQIHCCKCKNNYDKACLAHCCICKGIFTNSMCYCREILNNVTKKISDIIKQNNISNQYIISKCIESQCISLCKFARGLKIIGFDNIREFFEDDSNYEIVFHGTPNIQNAKIICCESWNIQKRASVLHGFGEYFTNSPKTAFEYADKTGAVIISILATKNNQNMKVMKLKNDDLSEKWYVVNNKINSACCLPVCIVKHIISIDEYKSCPIEETVNKICVLKQKVHFLDDDDRWYKFDETNQEKILEKAQKNNFVFDIIITIKRKEYKYNIDLLSLEQMNKKTGTIRHLKIE